MPIKAKKGITLGGTDVVAATTMAALPDVSAFGLAQADKLLVSQGGTTKEATAADVRRFVPFEYTLFHGGVTGVYTLTPLTAGTVEPANAPMARGLADLALATQMRLVIGLRVVAAGGTTCTARVQYATNGVTQTTWADMQNTGTGVNLMTGTANVIREGGWVDLVSGAKIDSCFFRLAFVLTGTTTTAPTLSWARVLFR